MPENTILKSGQMVRVRRRPALVRNVIDGRSAQRGNGNTEIQEQSKYGFEKEKWVQVNDL